MPSFALVKQAYLKISNFVVDLTQSPMVSQILGFLKVIIVSLDSNFCLIPCQQGMWRIGGVCQIKDNSA